jgi:hypothetical protein
MKSKIMIKLAGIGLMSLFLTLMSTLGYSQACPGNQIRMSIQNITSPAPNQIEFDVYLTNTGTTVYKFQSFSPSVNLTPIAAFTAPTSTGIACLSIVQQPTACDFPGYPNLNAPINASWLSNGTVRHIRLTQSTSTNLGSPYILPIGATPMKFCRIRYTQAANFAANTSVTVSPNAPQVATTTASQGTVYCHATNLNLVNATPTALSSATSGGGAGLVIGLPLTGTANPQASGPSASVLSGTTSICAGGSTNLSVAITGGTGPYTVVINPGSITVNGYNSGSPIAVSPASTTTYTLTSVTDAGSNAGTGNTGNPTVTVNALPTVTAGNVSGCAGSSISLVGSPAGGTFSVANPYTGPTTTYTYSYTDGNGCSATSTAANITVNAAPTVTAGNVSGCAGSSISLVGSPAGGTFSVPNPYTGPTTTYTYSYTDGNGCSATSTAANITVNAAPTVTAGNVTGCAGSSISLVGSPAGGTFSVADPYTGPTTTYTYSYTDGNGCSATSTAANITVNALPTVSTTAPPAVCAGTPVALVGSPTGGTFSVANPYTGPSTTYTYSYTDGNGCTATTAPTAITVNALPTVTAGNVSGCAGSSISLVGAPAGGTFSAANPYTGPSTTYTYTYTDGNGCTATSASASITTNALPTVTAGSVSGCAGSAIALAGLPAGGTYSLANPYTGPSTTYTYTYTDGNGCTNTSASAAITAINCASCQLVVDYNSLVVSPISYTTATVSWTAVPTAVSYKIQYRPVGSSVWNGQTVVANSTNIIGLAMGTAYEVQIRANCVTGSGTYSPSKLFSTLANPCGMPTTLTATGMTATTALLSWSNTGATSYSVRVRVVGSPWAGATATGTPTNSFTATGLMPGTNYEFQVIGNCAGIFSAWSTQVGTFTTTGTPCVAPSGLNATAVTMTGATLNWSNTGATSYSFGFRIVGSPTWGSSSVSLTNSKAITGLVANTNYEFRVTSNCNGVFSPWSPVVGTFNTGSLMKPIVGTVESTSSEVTVYPNPTKDKLNIEFTAAVSEDAMVKVMDMTGRVVKVIRASVEAGNNTIEVSLSEFSAGMYTIQLFENNSLTHVGKIQKQD